MAERMGNSTSEQSWTNERQREEDQALYDAASNGDLEGVLSSLESGANVDYQYGAGWTPLMEAAASGYEGIVSALVKAKADVRVKNSYGDTALDLARDYDHHTVVKLLEVSTAYSYGIEEGHVFLTSKKLVLMGPPCVGKTAFKCLLFNWPPLKYHHSTSIGARSIRAIERVTDRNEGNVWDIVESEEVLSMLTDAIEANEKEDPTSDSQLSDSDSVDSVDTPLEDASHPVATHSNIIGDTKARVILPTRDYSRNIIDQLGKKKSRGRSKELHKATWIHVLDSGGQPQFADISRAFLRGNALNVIVIKLTEKLSDKPQFVYSLNGKMVHAPSELAMTNIQLIEHFVRSVAASKNTTVKIGGKKIVTKPFFIVIGTYLDQAMKGIFTKKEVISESMADKNHQILSVLHEFREHLIFYNDDSDELIFPVDNLCWFNRRKISAQIRERIMAQEGVGFKVPIPVRWYIFELHVREIASKEEHGIISIESCYDIGAYLKMDREDVKASLVHMDSLTSCLYYYKLLPGIIFINPQYLLDLLSNVIRVSFVTDLDEILPEGQTLPPDAQRLLCEDGVFEESLLNTLGLPFVTSLFTKAEFLKLLKHLRVIAPIHSTDSVKRYYLPIALSPDQLYLTEEDIMVFTETCDPVIIEFKMKFVPQGVFPSLVVSLVGRKESPLFYIDSRSPTFPRQLRYAVKLYSDDLYGSVLLLDRFKHIEVYFTGFSTGCSALFDAIQKAIISCGQLLGYNEMQLETSVTLLCRRAHRVVGTAHSVMVTYHNGQSYGRCTVETELAPLPLTNRQLCWLSVEDIPVPVDQPLPNGRLNEGHAPVILANISGLVEGWDTIGVLLGLEYSVMQEIKYNCHYQVQTCRKEMIIKWLQKGNATRQSLVSALRSLQMNAIAQKIESLPTD